MLGKWLIAVDLDGTLFHTDHQISARTSNVLNLMVELGHRVVVLTGRSSYSSVPRLLSMSTCTRVICSNGAYEYDRENQIVVWARVLTASNSMRIRQEILDYFPTASFGWESVSGLTYEKKFIEEAGGAHTLEQGGIHEPIGQLDLFKMYVRTPEKTGNNFANSLQEIFGRKFEVSSSGAPFVEITTAGTNKGVALAKVASELGFESDRTIAFGDNQNDIAMLQWAGVSVAMGNATLEVQSVANARTQSNAEDGVAQFLQNKFVGVL